jgi:hypothetical protein
MCVIKVTKDSIVNVCQCGATTEYGFADVTVTPVAAQFPICSVCKKYISGVFANPYSDQWETLGDDAIRRQVIGQIVHKLAVEHKDSKTDGTEKEHIKNMCEENGRYFAVPDDFDSFEAEPSPQFIFAMENFKKTKKPYITEKEKRIPSAPKDSKVFKVLSGKKE